MNVSYYPGGIAVPPWMAFALAVVTMLTAACQRRPSPRRGPAVAPSAADGTPSCLVLPPVAGTPVARVGEVTITAEQLEARLLAERGGHQGGEPVAALRDVLDDQVRFELLAQAALARHLDRDPEVIDAARRAMVRKLVQQDIAANEADQVAVEAAARAYYDKHHGTYLLPEKRRFAQIELPHSAAGRSQAVALIERMRRHRDLRETFGAMAQKFSKDVTTRSHGGEEPFATFDEVAKGFGSAVATAVFAQDPNGLAQTLVPQPIESGRGWHVLHVAARREALVRDFDEVKDVIAVRLAAAGREEKFRLYLNDLRKRCPVAIYDGPLEQVAARWKAHR